MSPAPELWPSDALVSDAVGRLIEFWGFKRNMGRVWAVLYLSDEPRTAQDLRHQLKLSAGSVSMTLTELQRWGVVRKIWIQGARRDHFVAEGNLWKMISRVFQERERVEITTAIEAMDRALEMLEARLRSDPADAALVRTKLDRVKQLRDLARLGQRMLDALLHRAQVDVRPLARYLLGSK